MYVNPAVSVSCFLALNIYLIIAAPILAALEIGLSISQIKTKSVVLCGLMNRSTFGNYCTFASNKIYVSKKGKSIAVLVLIARSLVS